MKMFILCAGCADMYKVAYRDSKAMKFTYMHKVTEGRCEECKNASRAGLAMYKLEKCQTK